MTSLPVSISRNRGGSDRDLPPRPHGGSFEASPGGFAAHSLHSPFHPLGSSPIAGSSPPAQRSAGGTAGDKQNPYAGAKRFWKRLCFDPSLDADEYTVGFLETRQQAERRSGAEAWSLRVHERLTELPFAQLAGRLAKTEEDEPPFHRIVYYKHQGSTVWESEYHRRRLGDLANGNDNGTPARARRNSSSGAGLPPLHPLPHGAAKPGSSAQPTTPSVQLALPRGLVLGDSSDDEVDHAAGNSDADDVCSAAGEDATLMALSTILHEEGSYTSQGLEGSSIGSSIGGMLPVTHGSLGRSAGRRSAIQKGHLLHRAGSGGSPLAQLTHGSQLEKDQSHEEENEESQSESRQLPEECWVKILCQLSTRDVCMMARTNRWLRLLCQDAVVWAQQYTSLFGERPPAALAGCGALRRACRRSELRAARWLESEVVEKPGLGYGSSSVVMMDESKAVTADGCSVRLWSHESGRRLSTLQGHTARVTALAYDDEVLLSGCTAGLVKVWAYTDDQRCRRTLRGHDAAISDVALLNGIPLSASEDGAIKLWDVTAGTPIVSLDAHHGVHAMRVNASSGQLVSCGWGLHVWDVAAAQMVSTLSGADDAVVPRPYTCVALFGNLVAAGRAGEVALFDVRSSQGAVGRLAWGYDSSSDSSSSSGLTGLSSNAPAITAKSMVPALGSIAAAAGAGVGVVLAPFGGSISIAGAAGAPGCVGVALDDWKLITGFAGGRHTLTLHDIRTMTASTSTVLNTAAAAASNGSSNGMRPGSSTGGAEVVTSWPEPHAVIDGSARDTSSSGSSSASAGLQGWQRPLLTLQAPARIIGFAMHDQRVLAGLEGAECILWRMDAPRGSAAAALAEATAAAALPAAGSTSCAAGGLGAKEKAGKDKGGKVRKLKTRFPKRGTK